MSGSERRTIIVRPGDEDLDPYPTDELVEVEHSTRDATDASNVPEWVVGAGELAKDPEWRALQIRWYKDDLWMRRIRFGIVALLAAASCIAVIETDALAQVLIGTLSALVAVLRQYLKTRR